MIPEAVYVLCMLTSLFCAVLLFRSYRAQRSQLLLWSTVCFVGLAISNALLVLDLIVLPDVDLRLVRSAVGFASSFALLGALVWELR
jgi:hydrogenase/urease accessory protein HupE